MSPEEQLVYEIAFASLRLPLQGSALLLQRVGSEKECMELSEAKLPSDAHLPPSAASLKHRTELVDEARKEVDFIMGHGLKTLYFTDAAYPRRLLECPDAPLMLYGVGDCDLNQARFVSIVGTRHATMYGTEMVSALVKDLKSKMADPLVIVSGLAFGIDISAHKAALDNDIPTVAVLAGGLNSIYPPQHRLTAIKMAERGGMLLSDYRSCDPVHKGNFLARNRIIAGLADCVVVAESSERGGALNTARLANDYDREVFAIPGRVTDAYSRGCNNLISTTRAHLLENAESLLAEMGWETRPDEGTEREIPNLNLDPKESAILKLLEMRGQARQKEIIEILNLSQKEVSAMLIDMEFRGLVIAIPGGSYRTAIRR